MCKRWFDILASIFVLTILSVPLAILALVVRVKLGTPVIFRQERPGFKGKLFDLYKFRTMTNAKNSDGELLPDDDRFTKFGDMLRATSLDELPELWNVLKGDMSLVGPRPLLTEYLPLYTKEQARRHDVRPGITGWAQVNGRNAISWEDKFDLDLWYIENQSFLLDIQILLKTVVKVIAKENINIDAERIAPRFPGMDNHEENRENVGESQEI